MTTNKKSNYMETNKIIANESDHYTHEETCRNCGKKQTVSIKKGDEINTALKFISCVKCGCALRKLSMFS